MRAAAWSCVLLAFLCGCASVGTPQRPRVTADMLQAHGRDVDACVRDYAPILAQLKRAAEAFDRVAQRFQLLALACDAMLARQDRMSQQLTDVIENNEQTVMLFRASQVLMVLNTLRAQQMQSAKQPLSVKNMVCEVFSGDDCQAMKLAGGFDTRAYECDHIVPLARGGANTADNIRIVPQGLNRSWGATWNAAKCLEVGPAACAAAAAVSAACGNYRGGIPR